VGPTGDATLPITGRPSAGNAPSTPVYSGQVPHIDVASSLLLVIDAQDGFYPPARIDVDHEAKLQVLDRVAWVCAVARGLDVPMIVTEEDADTNGPTAPQVVNALVPGTVAHVKTVFGATENPAIAAAIDDLGRGVAVIVGMETDVCVAHSALGLSQRGLRPVVVHDAVYSAGTAHEFGLARLRAEGVELVSAKELYYEWLRALPAARAFDEAHPELGDPPGFAL